ncbi:MAG: hypothetical protein NXI18_19535 [Alphaproteobacteria bacterium]|nr:hypothetical protein [Alphaproteobacteria bacterium]
MSIWARIQSGTVVELTSHDPDGRYHPDLAWVAVPAEWEQLVAPRCRYVSGAFRPPLAHGADGQPLETDDMGWLAAQAIQGVRSFAAEARIRAAGTSDPVEIASWAAKEAMAKRHQAAASTADDDAALQAEADLRSSTVPDLVDLILVKAAAYKLAAGKIQGWQRQAETLIATEVAASNPSALVLGLATLKAQATAELETLLQQLQS